MDVAVDIVVYIMHILVHNTKAVESAKLYISVLSLTKFQCLLAKVITNRTPGSCK